MSGPKVVRITTREERIAICRGLLAQLDGALAEWQKKCEKLDLASAEEIEATFHRRKMLHALLERDAFGDLQDQVPREIAFLRSDLAERRTKAQEKKARERDTQRRLADVAANLLTKLADHGGDVPADLEQALQKVKNGGGSGAFAAERAISEAIHLLAFSDQDAVEANVSLRELARRLSEGLETKTLADWLAQRPAANDGTERFDRLIAELDSMEGEEAARPFVERATRIADESSPQRRQLLGDSLCLDIASQVKMCRERETALSNLSALVAELNQVGGETTIEIIPQAERAIADRDGDGARQLIPHVRAAIYTARKVIATTARRKAMLKALSSLGYEVREGMETGWVKDGNITLRNAARPEAGVRLTGGGDAERVEMRAVRFAQASEAANPECDRDLETLWCSDFDSLKKHFAQYGSDITIERAEPVGRFPVERVEIVASDMRREASGQPPVTRKLK